MCRISSVWRGSICLRRRVGSERSAIANVRQIKAALWDQAFIGCTSVSCRMGRVVAIRKKKGQLQAKILGWVLIDE